MTVEDIEYLDPNPTDGCRALFFALIAVVVVAVVLFAAVVLFGARG